MKWMNFLKGTLVLIVVAFYYQPLGKAIRYGFPAEAPVDIQLPAIRSSAPGHFCDCNSLVLETNEQAQPNVGYLSVTPDHNRLHVLKCLHMCYGVRAEYACHSVHDQPNHLFRELIRQMDMFEFAKKLLCLLRPFTTEQYMLTLIMSFFDRGAFIIRDCPLTDENRLWMTLRNARVLTHQQLIWVTVSTAHVWMHNMEWDRVAVRHAMDFQPATSAEAQAIFRWMRGREITEAEALLLSIMNSYRGKYYPRVQVVTWAHSIVSSLLGEQLEYGPFITEYIMADRYFESLVFAMMKDLPWDCQCFTDERIGELFPARYVYPALYLSRHLCCGWKITCAQGSCLIDGWKHYNATAVDTIGAASI